MEKIIRAEYRACLKQGMTESEKARLAKLCEHQLEERKKKGEILTGGLYCYESMCFLYLEYIIEIEELDLRMLPELWFSQMGQYLEVWPQREGKVHWVYMYPVFWSDEPQDLESWERKIKPDQGCGRIAVLYPDKLFSYVCHHQALVQEGLLVGDRYQFISLHENILFSYFEIPRDRERVNIRRSPEKSIEIERWQAAEPDSHFYHFPEAEGADFLIIETLCWVC